MKDLRPRVCELRVHVRSEIFDWLTIKATLLNVGRRTVVTRILDEYAETDELMAQIRGIRNTEQDKK